MADNEEEKKTAPEANGRAAKKEDASDKWKSEFSWITTILTVAGLLIGVWEFNKGQKNNEEIEFKRKMWEKRLDMYSSLGNLVGDIVVSQDKPKRFDSLYIEFEKSYFARMPLLEDSVVSNPLRKFKLAVEEKRDGFENLLDVNPIESRALDLMDSCQASLLKTRKQLDE